MAIPDAGSLKTLFYPYPGCACGEEGCDEKNCASAEGNSVKSKSTKAYKVASLRLSFLIGAVYDGSCPRERVAV